MASGDLKIEIEVRMYWIKANKKKWWQFWIPKEIRVLSDSDSIEEASGKIESGEVTA